MSDKSFDQHLDGFSQWKTSLNQNVQNLRDWLNRNQLMPPESQKHLEHLETVLTSDYLTLAFVGEFSRGKTELINAIFFGDYGQRILPSQAGRTTMCPTELFYDREEQRPYLRLLPIETRLQGMSLTEYRNMPGHWVDLELPTDSADGMAKTMRSVTQTKKVSMADAVALGFEKSQLKKDMDRDGKVTIPAWRHALVSFPHPLLERGLCILDTPGLNALGSEPDLTLNLLPQAQAVIFVLAADAGVTASDMAIWENHVKDLTERPNVGVYAVLNKIDYLWDDIDNQSQHEQALERVRDLTARQLELSKDHILATSAQKALLAKSRDDKALLAQSRLLDVENVIGATAMLNKQQQLHQQIADEASWLLQSARSVVDSRRQQLVRQREELESLKGVEQQQIAELLEISQREQEAYSKKLLSLQPSKRLLSRQSHILLNTIDADRINQMITLTRRNLIKSWTTLGLSNTMREFFESIEGLVNQVTREMELANKMARSIYDRFTQAHSLDKVQPRLMTPQRYRGQLIRIRRETELYNRQLKLTMTEQSYVVRSFFATTVSRISDLLKTMRQDLHTWSEEAVTPLMQHVQAHKTMVETHLQDLQELRQNGATAGGRLKALATLTLEFENELQEADRLLQLFGDPLPQPRQNPNVVELSSARAR